MGFIWISERPVQNLSFFLEKDVSEQKEQKGLTPNNRQFRETFSRDTLNLNNNRRHANDSHSFLHSLGPTLWFLDKWSFQWIVSTFSHKKVEVIHKTFSYCGSENYQDSLVIVDHILNWISRLQSLKSIIFNYRRGN